MDDFCGPCRKFGDYWGWRNDRPPVCDGVAHAALLLLLASGCNAGFIAGTDFLGWKMKTPDTTKAVSSALNSVNSIKSPRFTPRQQRALDALWTGPKMREALDRMAGCSNGPQLVRDLRDKGIDIDCVLIESIDRDGRPCKPGRYELTHTGRTTLDNLGWSSGERAE